MVMGVSLELESERKPSCVSLMVPPVRDMVQQTRYLQAGVGRESEPERERKRRRGGSELSE